MILLVSFMIAGLALPNGTRPLLNLIKSERRFMDSFC